MDSIDREILALRHFEQLSNVEVARVLTIEPAAASLQHPNILPIYDVGEEGGVYYYTTQLVEGSSFHEVVQEVRRLRSSTEGAAPQRADGHRPKSGFAEDRGAVQQW